MDLALDRAYDQLSAFDRPKRRIEVRVRAIKRRDSDIVDHALRHVAVQVQRQTDRYARPDQRSNPCGDLAVDIVILFGDGRAVVRQQDSVPRTVLREHLEHLADNAIEGILGDHAARLSLCIEQWNDIEAKSLARLEEARDG